MKQKRERVVAQLTEDDGGVGEKVRDGQHATMNDEKNDACCFRKRRMRLGFFIH